MAIAYLGAVVVDASGGDGSDTITIPSGATFALIQCSHWDGDANNNIASVSIDGQSSTDDLDVPRSVDLSGYWQAWCKGFATGSGKTIAWTWNNDQAIDEGGALYVTFWSGVDLTTPISDSDGDRATSSTNVSATVSTAVGEVVVTHCQSFDRGSPEITPNGSPTVNSVYDNDLNSSELVDIDYFARTQASHVCSMTGEDFSTVMVAVLAPAAAGGRTVSLAAESLEVTPQTVAVSRSRTVGLAAESLEVTPQAATVSRGRTVSLAAESLEVTPQAVTVSRGRTVSLAAESLEVAAQAVTVSLGSVIALTAESLEVAAQAVTVSRGRTVSLAAESLEVAPQAVTVTLGSVIALTAESLEVAAQAVTVSRGRTVGLAAESLEVAPQAVTVTRGAEAPAAQVTTGGGFSMLRGRRRKRRTVPELPSDAEPKPSRSIPGADNARRQQLRASLWLESERRQLEARRKASRAARAGRVRAVRAEVRRAALAVAAQVIKGR